MHEHSRADVDGTPVDHRPATVPDVDEGLPPLPDASSESTPDRSRELRTRGHGFRVRRDGFGTVEAGATVTNWCGPWDHEEIVSISVRPTTDGGSVRGAVTAAWRSDSAIDRGQTWYSVQITNTRARRTGYEIVTAATTARKWRNDVSHIEPGSSVELFFGGLRSVCLLVNTSVHPTVDGGLVRITERFTHRTAEGENGIVSHRLRIDNIGSKPTGCTVVATQRSTRGMLPC